MKITAFGVNQEEQYFFEKLAFEKSFELVLTAEWVTADNVVLAAGSDAISTMQTGAYDEALFKKMAALNIPLLALRNVGTDNIDFAAAKKYGIKISNVPSYSPATIAEFVVLTALQLLRRTKEMGRAIEAGQLIQAQKMTGRTLFNETFGVIGTGHIGFTTAELLHNMGVKVVAFDAFPKKDAPEWLHYTNSLEELLQQANLVTLHVPGIKENDHLLDAERLALLPQDALVINTGRGNLIDTDALIAALETKHLAGAGIDVFEYEADIEREIQSGGQPLEPHYLKLQSMPNVIITPHIAYHSMKAVEKMVANSVDNIFSYVQQGTPLNPVE
ncbi:NAD(P)-dependent oxidoreductase [Lapidilactobacillus bayanensis]|uniref:NAD(P)-dependent oxidoreductase n=1 Tax=Lapidilactobacillus bayanensis TaxID=2485998 RepID=UPI0013DDAC27|nr:NAD(P)-dependent oxidoreductase [Lapidilactobacillus bayanensis]